MNLSNAKVQLEKIIALYKNMSQDAHNINAIERDLMLNYIRQLYEAFLDTPPSVSSNVKPKTEPTYTPPVVEAPKPTYTPPVVETPKPTYTPPVVETPKPTYTPPVVETPKPTYTPPVVETPKPTYTPPAVVPTDIEQLFDVPSAKELSERLANTPIADLSKAFGLNDRLLIMNELFGGNKAVFDSSLLQINQAGSFEAAKQQLAQLATQYNWLANEDKKRHAKQFINTIRRRF